MRELSQEAQNFIIAVARKLAEYDGKVWTVTLQQPAESGVYIHRATEIWKLTEDLS